MPYPITNITTRFKLPNRLVETTIEGGNVYVEIHAGSGELTLQLTTEDLTALCDQWTELLEQAKSEIYRAVDPVQPEAVG